MWWSTLDRFDRVATSLVTLEIDCCDLKPLCVLSLSKQLVENIEGLFIPANNDGTHFEGLLKKRHLA